MLTQKDLEEKLRLLPTKEEFFSHTQHPLNIVYRHQNQQDYQNCHTNGIYPTFQRWLWSATKDNFINNKN